MTNRLRILIVKESQNWPRSSGHDVHAYHMMKALSARGHAISLATIASPLVAALSGLTLAGRHELDVPLAGRLKLTAWQRRFMEYYGVKDQWGLALAEVLRGSTFDAVVLVSRHLLPLLSVVRGPVRVWYPADDPAWHHLSRIKVRNRQTWGEIKTAAINALFERAFRPCFDRVWVVSPADRTAARLITGCGQVDLIPNGVDADYYSPGAEPALPESCVFWGRLDFGPNEDALAWFLSEVWPAIKTQRPQARFAVFGFHPTERIRQLAAAPGVELHADLPDLRGEVSRRQVVVLPFVSGGGVKNKLLEAAALGLPIVCTPLALSGTKGKPPVRVARTSQQWAATLAELWTNPTACSELGKAARRWVIEHHTWESAAKRAEMGIGRSQVRREFWFC